MSEFQAQCDTFRQGFCDGTKRLRCAACGGWGHGNCYGNGSGALEVPCEHVCPGREAAREDARDEVVRAARDLWAHATVVGHPVDEESRWMRLGTAVAALARLEVK